MILSNVSETSLEKEREIALELLSLLSSKLVISEGRPHAATLLSAAAWLTGMSLHQSFPCKDRSLTGATVTSPAVNSEWENLVYLLETYNFQRADIPVGHVVLSAMGRPLFFKPQVEMSYVQSELQEQYDRVMKRHGLSSLEGARVGILLCSMLIQQYSKEGIISPDAATGIVAQGIFEAASQCSPS
jgi:hypothetical protein